MDPLLRSASHPEARADAGPLFALAPAPSSSTSQLALAAALPSMALRRREILQQLASDGPLAIFEVAQRLGRPDHTISPRFSAMERDQLIERTGARRRKESTQCL